jgi:hypothetical protein
VSVGVVERPCQAGGEGRDAGEREEDQEEGDDAVRCAMDVREAGAVEVQGEEVQEEEEGEEDEEDDDGG